MIPWNLFGVDLTAIPGVGVETVLVLPINLRLLNSKLSSISINS